MGNLYLPLFYMLIPILYHFAAQTCIISLTELTAESSNWEKRFHLNIMWMPSVKLKALQCCITCAYVYGPTHRCVCVRVHICAESHKHIRIYVHIRIWMHTRKHPFLDGEFWIGFPGVSPHNPIEFQWGLSGKLPEECFALITFLSCL